MKILKSINKKSQALTFISIIFSINALLYFMGYMETQSPYKLAMTFIWLQLALFNILIFKGFTKNLFWILAGVLTVLLDITVASMYFYLNYTVSYLLPLMAAAVLFTVSWPIFARRKEELPRLFHKNKI